MTRTIRIAGFGGQGVMLTGQLLAKAATKQGLHCIWVPTYGPETRGGTANCAITISDEQIYSPVFNKSDDLIVFNGPSLDKFIDKVKEGGNLFYNSSIIKTEPKLEGRSVYAVPMNDIAISLSQPKVANMAMMGAYLKMVDLFDDQVIIDVLTEFLGEKRGHLVSVNQEAIRLGGQAI
ncbi:MAG: 2-oxoacid:acceptor oxidoreductase family protein [Acholeplasmataceae bacterium]